MECESFSSPHATPNPVQDDTAWHKSVLDRNLGWSKTLLAMFSENGARGPILDIGCGIGSLVLAAKREGIGGVGYDLDGHATEFGREEFGLDLRTEHWTRDTDQDFGLITCISVLEHIHQPRQLIADMLAAAKKRGAAAYFSVPFVNRPQWKMLHTDNKEPGHLFAQPTVHVTHFSHKGFEKVCREFGAEDYQLLTIPKAWQGAFIRFGAKPVSVSAPTKPAVGSGGTAAEPQTFKKLWRHPKKYLLQSNSPLQRKIGALIGRMASRD